MLGWHWLACATGCAPEHLADATRVRGLLEALPNALGLRAVSAPVVRATGSGLAGVVLLAESHVAVHTAPADATAWVDVFSCVHFDPAAADALVATWLGAGSVRAELVARGPAGGLP